MIEVYRKLPKESFELILRNIAVRDYMKRIWEQYNVLGKLEYVDHFDKMFEELFRFFIRPFEVIIFNERFIRSMFPMQDFLSARDLISAYADFVESLASHMKLTLQLLSQPIIKTPVDKFIEDWMDFARKFEVPARFPQDLPFALPADAKNYLIDCMKHWGDFVSDYEKYREMLRNSFRRSIENFCNFLSKSNVNSFDEFKNSLQDYLAKEFDALLKSEDYLKLQQRLFDALFDHIYCLRRFLELLLENNPASPFATVSQLDEAYKRIMDLRRKILELEKRIEALEVRLHDRKD
uniref:Poly(3-hydroxyalkanoate) polymerase subunit PhaE n=1 Tax=Archaeoglobus fulgidus TaxID=2234 RepID=A0A7J2TJM5_ARCFL